MSMTEEIRPPRATALEGGVGEGKQPSRAWPPGGEVQVLWENHDGVGQGRLPAEVVPKVSP